MWSLPDGHGLAAGVSPDAAALRADAAAGAAPPPSPRDPSADDLWRMAGIGCWEWHVAGNAFAWSAGMYALYGLSPETFTPTRRAILDRVVPGDVQAVLDTWWKDSHSSPQGAVECRIVRPDGDIRHVRYAWRTVDADTPGARVCGIAQDITALRGTRTPGLFADASCRGFVADAADYIWEHRGADGAAPPDGLTLRAFREGGGPPGAAGPVVDRAGDHDFDLLRRVVAGRLKFHDVLLPILDAEGDPRWISLSGHPQFDRDGAYYGYRGVGADVTDRVRERDREEDRRRAGAVGRLASGLAHEINNLLQPIMIYAAFGMDEAGRDEKLRLYFSRIARAAERATFIVKNVLSFTRRTPPSREDLNVSAVVRETVDLMSGAVGGRARIVLAAEAGDITARVERTGLAQIVTNLVANAADALAEDGEAGARGGGLIAVRVDAAAVAGEAAKAAAVAPGRYCRIAVEDGGPGIPAQVLPKVFEPFFTTKPQGKGTGLGLAVAVGIARSWGGGIAAESTPGRGCRFTVYLPLAAAGLRAAQ